MSFPLIQTPETTQNMGPVYFHRWCVEQHGVVCSFDCRCVAEQQAASSPRGHCRRYLVYESIPSTFHSIDVGLMEDDPQAVDRGGAAMTAGTEQGNVCVHGCAKNDNT